MGECKAYCRSVEKIPYNVGARTHPCFTPLVILKGWDEVQSKLILLWVFSWKDDVMLRSVGGHPIFFRIFNNLSLLTKLKALVRSMKAMYSGLHSSLHFSHSCLREKTMSIGDLPALNHIVIQGRCKQPVFVTFLASLRHILCQQSLGVIYLNNCCSHCGHLCFCTS